LQKKISWVFRDFGAGRKAFLKEFFFGQRFWLRLCVSGSVFVVVRLALFWLGAHLKNSFCFSPPTKFFCSRLPPPIPRRFLVAGANPLLFARVAWRKARLCPCERRLLLPEKTVLQPARPSFREIFKQIFSANGRASKRHIQPAAVIQAVLLLCFKVLGCFNGLKANKDRIGPQI
jgi:hypothetical protein